MSRQQLTFISEDNVFIFNCPCCLGTIVVHGSEVNCQIFRHAVLKTTGSQVSPHASKNELDTLLANDLLHGCGGPFQLFKQPGGEQWSYAETCDYI